MTESFGSKKVSSSYKMKEFVAKTSLLALGVTFELISRLSDEAKKEIAGWKEGRVFALGILPSGPYISIKKEGDRLQYLGMDLKDPDVTILFKNLEAAMLSFTGQQGAHIAAAQHRFIVQGNISESMQFARGLGLVQKYLFPGIMLNKISKRAPTFTPSQLWVKANIMARLTPGLLFSMNK